MASLRAFTVNFDVASHHASWFFGLIKGFFEVVNGHLNQLEELELNLRMPLLGLPGDPKSGWGLLRSTGLTEPLVQQANLSGGCFPSLRFLSLQANLPLFSLNGDKPLGLYCFLHYTYPALRELRLNFPEMGLFLSHLIKSPRGIRHFNCSIMSNTDFQKDQLALIRFIESFEGLSNCSIMAIAVQMVNLKPVIAALLNRHGQTLSALEISTMSNVHSSGGDTGRLCNIIEEFSGRLPRLNELKIPYQGPTDSRESIQLANKHPLTIITLSLIGSRG